MLAFFFYQLKVHLGYPTNSLAMAYKTHHSQAPAYLYNLTSPQTSCFSRTLSHLTFKMHNAIPHYCAVAQAVSSTCNFFPHPSFLHSEPNSNVILYMNLFLTSLNKVRYFLFLALVAYYSYITISTSLLSLAFASSKVGKI